ncbi:MAG TPA: prolipoprotein diacylglyceryl transferase [Candidatus Kryptonia bacterium]|nr:prolipoprotein diacylglyceryl transferase [Candidatus Kryptonia bacterium]
MYPVLFQLGPISVESFWVMLFLGFFVALQVVRAEFRRLDYDPSWAYDFILYAYVGGLIGARLFLLTSAWDVFVQDPFEFLFSGSGWVWQGGVMGGALAVWLGCWHKGLPIAVAADVAAPAMAIGQAIGRIGCQLSGDGDYGVPTTLPWAMSYPHGTVPTEQLVHPAPIYEMLLYGAIFWLLWRLRHRGYRPGILAGVYFVTTGAARFVVEFVRINRVIALGLTLPQLLSIGSCLLGLALCARPWTASASTARHTAVATHNS